MNNNTSKLPCMLHWIEMNPSVDVNLLPTPWHPLLKKYINLKHFIISNPQNTLSYQGVHIF